MRPLIVGLLSMSTVLCAQQSSSAPDKAALFEHAKAATVVILTGEGGGRLQSIATGAIISKDGTILTALHVVKSASEVQVRLANGDVFDRVDLVGSDERRDIAALKIYAGNLAAFPISETNDLAPGQAVYAVTNAGGLTWSATEGILSAKRSADEIPGAGTGFRVLQFTAPVAPGASGGALLDASGALIGIITSAKGNAAFAIPVDSVAGLAASGQRTRLGSGASLQMPASSEVQAPQSSEAIANLKPQDLLRRAKTVFIHSKTSFLTVDTLVRALILQKGWESLGLTLVQDKRVADLIIEVDRPLFTYVHTFVITDKRTSIVLGSGKQTAFDGTIASGGLAKDIVKIFAAARVAAPSPSPKK